MYMYIYTGRNRPQTDLIYTYTCTHKQILYIHVHAHTNKTCMYVYIYTQNIDFFVFFISTIYLNVECRGGVKYLPMGSPKYLPMALKTVLGGKQVRPYIWETREATPQSISLWPLKPF